MCGVPPPVRQRNAPHHFTPRPYSEQHRDAPSSLRAVADYVAEIPLPRLTSLSANVTETATPVAITVEGQLGIGHDAEDVGQEERDVLSARGDSVSGPGGRPVQKAPPSGAWINPPPLDQIAITQVDRIEEIAAH
jgi:hypothetical protein